MPRFATFDDTVPEPRPVLGWWDTDEFDYGEGLPPPPLRVELTAEQWDARLSRAFAVQGGHLVPYTHPTPPPQPYDVSALLLTDRLAQAGLLRTALTALKLDAPLADINDEELVLRERWRSAASFLNTDQDVRTFLGAIGGDVDALLAPPPNGT